MKPLLLAAAVAAGPARAAPIQLPPIEDRTLPNGLLVAAVHRRSLPLVSIRLLVPAGSARDPRGKEGLAHLVGALLRRGTAAWSAEQIDDAVESIGGRLSVDVGPDALTLALSAPSERLEELLRVAAELVARPSFPPAEVDAARERTLAALKRDLDEPSAVANRAMALAAFGDHPYGHPPEGWTRTVKTLGRDDVTAFHKAAYAPKGSILVVAGDVAPAQAHALAERAFSAWSGPAEPLPPVPPPPPPRPLVFLVDKPDATQSQVRLLWPAVTRQSPDYHAQVVAATALGGGFTSRLVDEVRVERGLTYSIGARASNEVAGARLRVFTFTKTETTREIVDVARRVIAEFIARGPSPKELEKTQRYLTGLYPLGLETEDDLARAVAEAYLYGVGYSFVSEYPSRIEAVTRKDVTRVAREQLGGAPALVVVGAARDVRAQLEGLGEIQVLPLSAVE